MAVGSVVLISRVAIGLVIPVLAVLGGDVCPIVCCLYCPVLVPAFVLTLIVTSISLAWSGLEFWPFSAGPICMSL